jgi:23S rRNA pseudouridine1911/1915/1917 synthase
MSAGSPHGKSAATAFRRLAKGVFQDFPVSLVECRLETGRTHQIRVHLESLGFPLLGDPVYRKKCPGVAQSLPFTRQALHAFALSLQHPQSHQLVSWFRAPPIDLIELLPKISMLIEDLPQEQAVLASVHQTSGSQ